MKVAHNDFIHEVEGLRYIEMHRGPHTYWARLLQGAEISN